MELRFSSLPSLKTMLRLLISRTALPSTDSDSDSVGDHGRRDDPCTSSLMSFILLHRQYAEVPVSVFERPKLPGKAGKA
ncbi:hypothetical protein GMORB2_0088 [Geosmithia morbida]|uniref:Uncharacterized protein n=1 Tax=Geosmithia morbida TaxID=1094350 RepID=A0A9P4Z2Q0_9HYPO|nr:uncharacterized protein GMORB2_0088 [Geosmithia morbida]KAF4126352.1 hypothetical protein GMORB2_0088 [Geosmithia morbida]